MNKSPWADKAIALPDRSNEPTEPALPTAKLRVTTQPTNPPRPIGITVFVDDKAVAVVTLEELHDAAVTVHTLEIAYEHR